MEEVSTSMREVQPTESVGIDAGKYIRVEEQPVTDLFTKTLKQWLGGSTSRMPAKIMFGETEERLLGGKKRATEDVPHLPQPQIEVLTNMLFLSLPFKKLLEELPAEQKAKESELSHVYDGIRRGVWAVRANPREVRQGGYNSGTAFIEGAFALLLMKDPEQAMKFLAETAAPDLTDTDIRQQIVQDQIKAHLDQIAFARQTASGLAAQQKSPGFKKDGYWGKADQDLSNRHGSGKAYDFYQKVRDAHHVALFEKPSGYIKDLDRQMQIHGYIQSPGGK